MGVSSWVTKKNLVCSFFVVINHDNCPIGKNQLVHLDHRLKDTFVLPSLSNFNYKSTLTHCFHIMIKEQRQRVVANVADGVNVKEFESNIHHILQTMNNLFTSPQTRSTIPLTTTKTTMHTHRNFVGGRAPTMLNIDNSYISHQVASSSARVHHKVYPIDDMEEYVPLSTGCFDHKFHIIKMVDKFVEAVKSAIGCNGLFPVQNCARHVGSVSYIGEQSKQSQVFPSPSKGPGEHSQFYCQNYINHTFWPFVRLCKIFYGMQHQGFIGMCKNQ